MKTFLMEWGIHEGVWKRNSCCYELYHFTPQILSNVLALIIDILTMKKRTKEGKTTRRSKRISPVSGSLNSIWLTVLRFQSNDYLYFVKRMTAP